MKIHLVLVISLSVTLVRTNAVRVSRTKIVDFKSKRDQKAMEYRPYFISNEEQHMPGKISTTEKIIISLLGRKLKNNAAFDTDAPKNLRIVPKLALTNKVVREINFKDVNGRRPIVQFKGYTTFPQNKKLIIRRHACHQRDLKQPQEISHNYVKSIDFNEDEEINTEIAPLDKYVDSEIFLPKMNKEPVSQSHYNFRDKMFDMSPSYRKHDSGEREDEKEFIFLKLPQIGFEYSGNNKIKRRDNSVFKQYRLFKRGVIEEENYETTAASFKLSNADTDLTSNIAFKNINV